MDLFNYLYFALLMIVLSGCTAHFINEKNDKISGDNSLSKIVILKKNNKEHALENKNNSLSKREQEKNNTLDKKKSIIEQRRELIKSQINNDKNTSLNIKSYQSLNKKITEERHTIERLLEQYTEKYPDVVYHKRTLESLIKERDSLPDFRSMAKQNKNYPQKKIEQKKDRSIQHPYVPKIILDQSGQYLTDFSYAGYRWGEQEIPEFQGKYFDVTKFGAIPDDKIDDTKSIQTALNAAHQYNGPAVLFFPEGRFILSEILKINRAYLVIRGVGGHSKKNSQLYFSKPILKITKLPEQIKKNSKFIISNNKKVRGKYYSPVSWSGGLIWVNSPGKNQTLFKLNFISGTQGKHIITYHSKTDIKVGAIVEIVWCANNCKDSKSLLKHVLDNQVVKVGITTKKLLKKGLIRQTVTIDEITDKTIKIKEPLLHDIKPQWGVKVRNFQHIKEIGIESLQIIFPETKYQGHLLEAGYNAIYLTQTAHGWIQDVYIKNSDSAILINRSKNITVNKVTISGRNGHYGIVMSNSNDVLVNNFNLYSKMIHGVSFGTASRLNVFTNGKIVHSPLDQHMSLNEQNLLDNLKIEINNVGNLFKHGGDNDRAPTSGAYNVFWDLDIKFKKNAMVKLRNAPSARLIGVHGTKTIHLDYKPNAYIEALNYPNIKPQSLYKYQLEKRLKEVVIPNHL